MRTIDLFAGCGGLSLGFQQAGFEIVAAFDNWQPAIEVYRDNFEHPIINLDLSQTLDYDIFKQYRPEIIIGSPPCQDFSSAGKRNENLGRANLTITFAEIIADVKPSWFLMENVDRIEKSQTFSRAKKILKNHGYGLTEKILNACYCGVPQMRKRLFLIGKIGENEQFLNQAIERNQSPKPMTIFDYLGSNLNLEYYYRHPRSYQRRGIFSIYEPSPTIRGVNRPIPKTYQKHSGDACDPNPYLRALTTRERSYLQTFPKNFLFKGNKSNLEQMIGNAVPVNLAKYIGERIMKYQAPTQEIVNYQQLQLF
jgi:DNA (cytosine-5)-methyltransferase 1